MTVVLNLLDFFLIEKLNIVQGSKGEKGLKIPFLSKTFSSVTVSDCLVADG